MQHDAGIGEPTTRLIWVLVLMAGLLVSVAAPSTAQAARSAPPKAGTRQTDAGVRAQWTAERMQRATIAAMPATSSAARTQVALPPGDTTPGSTPPSGPSGLDRTPSGEPAGTLPSASFDGTTAAATAYADGWASGARYHTRTGKLYYNEPDGSGHVCSATVVAQAVIMTAAHCVYATAPALAGWNTSFLFVPAKWGASEPYGSWTGRRPTAYGSYFNGYGGYKPFFGLDYAFIKLNPRNGVNVGDVLGWDGVTWGSYTSYRSLGYPAQGWFVAVGGGNYPWFTESDRTSSYAWGSTGYYDVRISNRANGGSSGGPWLVFPGGAPYVNSVNSMCTRTADANMFCTYMDGPFLTSAVKTLLDYANTL